MPKPYIPNDKWSKRAAAEGYRARSVYKLVELDERFHLLKPGYVVLDLGASPGSWMQYAVQQVGPKGLVIGVDLQHIEDIAKNAITYKGDMTDLEYLREVLARQGVKKIDTLLSDAAPNTSGIKDMDQWKSVELATAAFAAGEKFLRPGGKIAVKVFRGADFDAFIGTLKIGWRDVKVRVAQASRDRSKEVYVIAEKFS